MIAFLLLYGWRSANLCRTLAASCSAQENSTGRGTAIDRLVRQERGLDKAYLPPRLATHRNEKYGVTQQEDPLEWRINSTVGLFFGGMSANFKSVDSKPLVFQINNFQQAPISQTPDSSLHSKHFRWNLLRKLARG